LNWFDISTPKRSEIGLKTSTVSAKLSWFCFALPSGLDAVRLNRRPRRPAVDSNDRGWTPNELAQLLRVSPDKIRDWIRRGEKPAINTATARCGKPRFIVLPHHLQEWERSRRAAAPKSPPRRRRQAETVDYYP
jgi:hypothetical protein